ncbi:unnamed protein product [Acanthoscelides obtectus]|uniref:Thrombospondin-like N-terminal domain-containing protein n=1 Tax=Acanthoscelides obtectus TaxID=200917 RepID=A0A9P0MCG0_ACAOB|nr:unnamed protein product [Acanthoscelides obtectus]CAK1670388.1 Thrombospondin-1 [Acanthoscelides obtectus]
MDPIRLLAFQILTLWTILVQVHCCDLEQMFGERQVSVEESTLECDVAFRGLDLPSERLALSKDPDADAEGGVVVNFDLVNTYKGADVLSKLGTTTSYRRVNVTFPWYIQQRNCPEGMDVPSEYIVFCKLVGNRFRVVSLAKWDEESDERVWLALGWSKWSEWSSCSVTCSMGIQQRTRHCLVEECQGFNVEQRHCNQFGCDEAVNPLELSEHKFFHPSKEIWRRVPDRPAAWHLEPNSYIWLPSAQLFRNQKDRPFPKQFAMFITIRIINSTLGTILSLRSRSRQDTYLSLEAAGGNTGDLKLVHAAANGTDVLRIPAKLNDGHWHQVALSIRDDSVVDTYVDCEWSRTDILRTHTLDIPDDSDLMIGYLFAGDLEQLTIVPDPRLVSLQCSSLRTPIIDPDFTDTIGTLQQRIGKHILVKIHKSNDETHTD